MGPCKRFSLDLKREVVRLPESRSRTDSKSVCALGIAHHQLCRWQTQLRARLTWRLSGTRCAFLLQRVDATNRHE
jgi:hypothetical protein